MTENILLGLACIVILGVAASWLAWRLRLPSILLLLIFGFIAGPATGFLNPDALFGDLLLPIVSLSVAIILFDGGLGLNLAELRKTGGVVLRLITLGAMVTWVAGAAVAYYVVGFEPELALLLGAILIVSGPTVILPILRQLRPSGQVGTVLRWEGIVIDPIGAILAVLVLQAIIATGGQVAASTIALGLVRTLLLGGAIGVLGALLLVQLLKHYWIPDFLHSVVTLALVIGVFLASNYLQAESGLLAVTVMGIALANQKSVNVRHIAEFKENLGLLITSMLFIILTARLELSELTEVGAGSVVLLLALVLVARPLAVFLSSFGSKLKLNERLFMSWMAPRGIVAASVSSNFALLLVEEGYAQAAKLVPLTFIIIAGTVIIYGLSAAPAARRLKVAEPDPQGVLMVGAHSWARAIANALHKEGIKVLMVDNNYASVRAARMEGLPVFYGNILSQYTMNEIDLGGIGRALTLTSDNAFNSLVVLQLANDLGRSSVFQLPVEGGEDKKTTSLHLEGRLLFAPYATYEFFERSFASGATIKVTELTEEFNYEAFREYYGESVLPLFSIDQNGKMLIFTADNLIKPKTGQKLISLIRPAEGKRLASSEG